MLVSWMTCRFVFVSPLRGHFAFATKYKFRAVARGGRSVSFLRHPYIDIYNFNLFIIRKINFFLPLTDEARKNFPDILT